MSEPGAKPAALARGVRAPPPPPPCPEGWRTGPPDFVGVGAQRCGTTRWFDLIAAHPQVQKPPGLRKELHYFDRYHEGGFGAAEAEGYHAHFPRPPGALTGEWTPLYLTAVWVPAMLAASTSEVRLLVVLRDPVERYRSALQHHRRAADAEGRPLDALAPHDAFLRGLYGAQLKRLLTHFERAQVLVLQYERCVSDPQGELRRTWEFLGLDDPGHDLDLKAHPNRQSEKRPLHADARRGLVDAYSEDVTELVASFPEIDVGLWPNFAQLAKPAVS